MTVVWDMDISPETSTDLAHTLPREAFHEIILILRGALPPPAEDTPAGEARRDRAAMAAAAALQPANAAEGRLAAQFVAADGWAMDCLRLAVERRREPDVARKCRAQSMSMMREAKSALRVLLRMQAVRRKIEADEAACGRAAWAEHGAMRMMEAALAPVASGQAAASRHDAAPPAAVAQEAEPEGDEGRAVRAAEAGSEEVAPGNVWRLRPAADPETNAGKMRFETEARPRRPGRAAS